jgi:hypothetical protein
MAIEGPSATAESPSKKRKVKHSLPKPWAKCDKLYFKDWRRDDFLTEFEINGNQWDLFDAQVCPRIPPWLMAAAASTQHFA